MFRKISYRRQALLLSCVAVSLGALWPMAARASTTYTTVTATWTGGTGDWTNPANWSTASVYPDNGTPGNTVYDAVMGAGSGGGSYTPSIGYNGSSPAINIDNLTVSSPNVFFQLDSGVLSLAQPDNGGAAGVLNLTAGEMDLTGGTLANAQLELNGGRVLFNSGSLQNVTLGTNVGAEINGSLDIMNSQNNWQGLNLNGQTLSLSMNGPLTFNDAKTGAGADVGEVLNDGALLIYDSSGTPMDIANTLTTGTTGVLDIVSDSNPYAQMAISGGSLVNGGRINIGYDGSRVWNAASTNLTTLTINTAAFTNAATGVVTIYSGNALNIDSGNFVNNGLIQTSNAAGLTSSGGASITLNGSWTNNGTIDVSSSDFLVYGSSPTAGGTVTGGGPIVRAVNTGNINVGSTTVSGVAADFDAANFSNSGQMTVYRGNTLQLGGFTFTGSSLPGPLDTWTNSGTIITQNAIVAGYSGARMNFYGNWSNTGTIQAGSGDTILLAGLFNPTAVGMASSGANGTFKPNGATVDFQGELLNAGNTLSFGAASGIWNAFGGIIEGGTLSVANQSNGDPYLEESYLTLENVTLGSNLTVVGGGQMIVNTGTIGVADLDTAQYAINLNSQTLIVFNSEPLTNSDIFHGTVNMNVADSGLEGGSLTLQAGSQINALANSGTATTGVNADQIYNDGELNAGSSTLSGATLLLSGRLLNNGQITAFAGDTADIRDNLFSSGFTNAGTLAAFSGGKISVGLGLELVSKSTLDIQLGSNGTSGLLTVDGSLQLDSGSALSLSQLAGSTFITPYDIINYTGTLTGTFTDVTPGYVLDYSHAGEILVTAVPEPTAQALFALGFAGLLLRRRKGAKSVAA